MARRRAQLDRTRDGALVELYLQSVSTPPGSFPSDEELQKVYKANRSALVTSRQFKLAQIFMAAPRDADMAVDRDGRIASFSPCVWSLAYNRNHFAETEITR